MNRWTTVAGRVPLGCVCLLLAAPSQAPVPAFLQQLRGRVVYLDFWASWCGPCRQSFPWMKALEQTYRKQGLTIVAVDVDHNHAAAERFLRAFRPNFRVIFDPRGTLAKQFKVMGMPTSVLIGRHGKVRFVHIGFFPNQRSRYEQQVRELLARK